MTYKSILASGVLIFGLSGAALAASSSPAITAADAVAAVEASSGGKVVQLLLADRNGQPDYQVSVLKSDGTRANFLIDGRTGKVTAARQVQTTAGTAADTTEAGEGPNDADSGNEDAN